MTTIPVPLTKSTLVAGVILLILLLAGRWLWGLAFFLGWTLGGDGKVFAQLRMMITDWRKSRVAG